MNSWDVALLFLFLIRFDTSQTTKKVLCVAKHSRRLLNKGRHFWSFNQRPEIVLKLGKQGLQSYSTGLVNLLHKSDNSLLSKQTNIIVLLILLKLFELLREYAGLSV